MIKGFLSTDYWVFVACLGAAVVLNILSLRTALTTSDFSGFFSTLLCSFIFLPLIRYKLKQKAKSKKFKEERNVSTINNFKISKLLISREK